MQATVTLIGQYNGAPAFEYEVQNELGSLEAVDFVVVHPRPGETWDDLVKLVRDSFLRTRTAQWEKASPEERAQMLEKRLGGLRLGVVDKGSATAPDVSGSKPSARHLADVNLPPSPRPIEEPGPDGV
jgi:hypothetical protein